MRLKLRWQVLIYFAVLIGFGLWRFNLLQGHRLTTGGDGGLIQFAIVDNIQKVLELDFQNWTHRGTFYPNNKTLAYTDHFYLHSFIGLPFYVLTRDPLATYNFIYFVQFMIAAAGFYLLGRQLGAGLFALVFCAIYFVYLPSFTRYHPQIGFYGWTAWFVFFCMKFVETRKPRYIYLAGLAYVLQSLVGIYLQLFMFMLTPIFLLLGLIHLRRTGSVVALIKQIAPHLVITLILTGVVLLLVNLPYLEFKNTVGAVRSLKSLIATSTDLFDLFAGTRFPGYSGLFGLSMCAFLLVFSMISKAPLPQMHVPAISLAITVAICLIALGPVLKIDGLETSLKMPYYYLYQTHFVFRSIRVASRILILLALPIAVMLLWLLQNINRRRELNRVWFVAMIGIAGLIVFDAHYRHNLGDRSGVYKELYIYEKLKSTPGEVLLELPSGMSHTNLRGNGDGFPRDDGYYSFMHIYHDKWAVNGVSGYFPSNTLRIITKIDEAFDNVDKLKLRFRVTNIDLVLIHRKRVAPEYIGNFKQFVRNLRQFGTVVHIDSNYILITIENGHAITSNE